jgi:hypothetical protein
MHAHMQVGARALYKASQVNVTDEDFPFEISFKDCAIGIVDKQVILSVWI